MELLFSWINCTGNKVIQKLGVNYSPKYDFRVTYSEHEIVLSLNNEWKSLTSIFKNEVIENVTAIVGKNGSGKTTLLKCLTNLDCSVPYLDNNRPGYEEFYKKEKQERSCVLVFRDGDKIKVYHNLGEIFVNKTDFETVDMSDLKRYRDCLNNQTDFKNILKLYITNSSYTEFDGISKQGKLDHSYLTPYGISTIAKSFYNKVFGIVNSIIHENIAYRRWIDVLKNYKKPTDFQQICDVLYYNRLFEIDKYKGYAGKVSTKLSVSVELAYNIFEKVRNRDNSAGKNDNEKVQNRENSASEDNEEKPISNLCNEVKKSIVDFKEDNIHIRNLVINLLCEICLSMEWEYPKDVNSLAGFKKWYKSKSISVKEYPYFEAAVEEIMQLKNILEKAGTADNVVPSNDLAYDYSLVLDYKTKDDAFAYREFLKYIANRVSDQHSFVLRYIKIGNPNMSSGERAFQNIFSWIHLVPIFHQFDSDLPTELRDNILLLIDELDLYLHPEWQQKFVKLLIDEVKSQFKDHKVQIIFATHSPLCLSDIPRENTVYMKIDNDIIIAEERFKHKQTFGRDIYTLFNDVFFLNNATMGEFAKEYINEIIKRIIKKDDKTIEYNKLTYKEICELESKISCIGNQALKSKLLSMLQYCYDDTENKLQYLRMKQAQIAEQIAKLEGKDDKN